MKSAKPDTARKLIDAEADARRANQLRKFQVEVPPKATALFKCTVDHDGGAKSIGYLVVCGTKSVMAESAGSLPLHKGKEAWLWPASAKNAGPARALDMQLVQFSLDGSSTTAEALRDELSKASNDFIATADMVPVWHEVEDVPAEALPLVSLQPGTATPARRVANPNMPLSRLFAAAILLRLHQLPAPPIWYRSTELSGTAFILLSTDMTVGLTVTYRPADRADGTWEASGGESGASAS